jgi:outer membrane protein assembly factor BamB
VYCLRAADGQLVWRLRAAPGREQIVTYGQIESPWPVAGSVVVIDDVAYFAAGRQPLADGGILVFAVEPATGQRRWVRRLDTVPTTNFYGCSGLEFDNFDLLQQEGAAVALSRWLFDRADGAMSCKATEVFARLSPGTGTVIVPRGCWTYAPRHQPRHGGERWSMRPLAVFRDNTLIGCLPDQRAVYRRDFSAEEAAGFNTQWITGWAASENFRKQTGEVYPSDRLTTKTNWSSGVFGDGQPQQLIAAMVWAGDTLLLAGSQGGLITMSARDGQVRGGSGLPPPVWDGLAVAGGRLFVATADGSLVALGSK